LTAVPLGFLDSLLHDTFATPSNPTMYLSKILLLQARLESEGTLRTILDYRRHLMENIVTTCGTEYTVLKDRTIHKTYLRGCRGLVVSWFAPYSARPISLI